MLRTSSAGRSHVRKRGRIVSDGQIAAIFLALLLLSLLCVGLAACAVNFASANPTAKEGAESETLPVSDIPMPKVIPAGRTMPLYLQDDVQWAHIEYAGDSTVAESGCGLTCAAMALEYLTNQKTTPRDLQGIVGDTCTVHGVNDMALFGDYMEQAYGLSQSEIYYDLNQAVADVADGSVVFASLTGRFGDSTYGGHIVAIWHVDGDAVCVRDPASGANSQRSFTRDELANVEWSYFYSLTNEGLSYA